MAVSNLMSKMIYKRQYLIILTYRKLDYSLVSMGNTGCQLIRSTWRKIGSRLPSVLGNHGTHHLRDQFSHAGGTEMLHAIDNFSFKYFYDLDNSCVSICLRTGSVNLFRDRLAGNIRSERIRTAALSRQLLRRGIVPSEYLRGG